MILSKIHYICGKIEFMQKSINRGLVRLWLVVAVLALGSLADVMEFVGEHSGGGPGAAGGGLAVAGLACVAALKATVLTCVYAFCRRRWWLKVPAIVLIAAFAILSLLNGFSWLFYGFGISRKLFTIMVETNPTEIGEFLLELTDKFLVLLRSAWFWVSIVLFAAAWIWLPRVPQKLLMSISGFVSIFGMGYLVFVFATADYGRTDHSVFARSYKCVAAYIRDMRVIRELQTKKRPFPHPETLNSKMMAERIVVVIGESASRDHLSLYGYPLPTSPRMDTISEGLYRFDDALASSTSTAQNMPRLISFITYEPDGKEWYEYPSLLQVFHNLGYRTYWLSNQEFSGNWSNLSSILSSDADVVEYVGSIDSEDHYLVRNDEALLPEWKKAFNAGDSLQLTFLHLMGSHFQYSHRFPEDRRHFSSQDVISRMPRKWLDDKKAGIIADYDNSILYTDSILGVVINDIRNSTRPTVLIYVSDHGENVYDDRDYRGRDPNFAEVPFVVYANEAYRESNPDIISDIEKSRKNPFSTSELPQMLMHLSGTRFEMYDSVREPIAGSFGSRQRYIDDKKQY